MIPTPSAFRERVAKEIPASFLERLRAMYDEYEAVIAIAAFRARRSGPTIDSDSERQLAGVRYFLDVLVGAHAPVAKPEDAQPAKARGRKKAA